ncbi:bacteriohemerythrin [Desulfofalx alkaliphila]|uniref:bacteriohemerythrin n=1 Tax=Desulfofalx alkaliphila TaxID=105483 RepID=UPI0004E1F150|nr:hemerythrin family protein [Desulfofalx alkaliphila]
MMWKEKYKIGVDTIDRQHEELFRRVSAFIQVVQQKTDWEEKLAQVKETMAFMQEYVIFHFDDEEAYQESINYPDLENHKKAHAKFKASVGQYAERLDKEGYSEELVQEFGGKLMTWLIMHVAAMDQKIGEYVQSQGDESK